MALSDENGDRQWERPNTIIIRLQNESYLVINILPIRKGQLFYCFYMLLLICTLSYIYTLTICYNNQRETQHGRLLVNFVKGGTREVIGGSLRGNIFRHYPFYPLFYMWLSLLSDIDISIFTFMISLLPCCRYEYVLVILIARR